MICSAKKFLQPISLYLSKNCKIHVLKMGLTMLSRTNLTPGGLKNRLEFNALRLACDNGKTDRPYIPMLERNVRCGNP